MMGVAHPMAYGIVLRWGGGGGCMILFSCCGERGGTLSWVRCVSEVAEWFVRMVRSRMMRVSGAWYMSTESIRYMLSVVDSMRMESW